MLKYKPFKKLTLQDDFMFFAVMRNPKHCKTMLERILGIKIRKIEFPIPQKSIDIRADSKGVRLDIYVEDTANTVYNIEMQTRNTKNLPMRTRYYQDLIDLDLLEKGQDFDTLKHSYVIFICTFDPFGMGYHQYQFHNICQQNTNLKLQDGTVKIFLNTKGTDVVDAELKTMLEYIETGIPKDEYTRSLDKDVRLIRENKKWRREYMTLQMKYNELMREGKELGIELGRTQGHAEGHAKTIIKSVCKKLQKQKVLAVIIDELEADEEDIKLIEKTFQIANSHHYDVNTIYEALKEII